MGMVESRGGARLALKTLQSLAVLGKMFRQKLQGDEAAELGVLGLIDHTHPAATQLLEDAVMRNGSAYHDGRPASARTQLCYRKCSEVNSAEQKDKCKTAARCAGLRFRKTNEESRGARFHLPVRKVNGTMSLFSSTCWVCYLRPPMKDLFLSGSATSEVLDHPDVAVHHLGHNGQVLPIGRGFTPEAKDTDRTPLLPQQLGISVKVHVEKCGSLRRHGPAVHP